MSLIIPKDYDPKLSIRDTEAAIRFIRENFQDEFGQELHLQRMSAPMFVDKSTGLNDNLNGIEKPVSFDMKGMPGETIEVVHSLAKWKRLALKKYGFGLHEGLYTNMNAIRKDEDLDNFHSIYVDQWDWEKIITKEERTEQTLKATVRQIFKVIKRIEKELWYLYPDAVYQLPDDIHFVTTQELEDRWPDLTPMEREDKIAKEMGAVFVMKIGDKLKRSGKPHDGRAPDYDDWSLNGDIIFWYKPLQKKLEISNKLVLPTGKNYHSIRCCSMANYHIQLVEELVNLGSACSCLVRLMWVKFKQVSGQKRCLKSVKLHTFKFYKK